MLAPLKVSVTRADLSQRAIGSLDTSPVLLDDAGEDRVEIVAAHHQIIRTKVGKPISSERSDRYARGKAKTNVEVAVAIDFNLRLAAIAIVNQLDKAGTASVLSGVRHDQGLGQRSMRWRKLSRLRMSLRRLRPR